MDHEHVIVDRDKHFIIDPITREIKPKAPEKTELMQYDHNSERFTFELPRYIEGHDMSLCNIIQVHYNNTQKAKPKSESRDVYEVTDITIIPANSEDEEDKVQFSWLISVNATTYVGKLAFIIRMACTEEDEIIYDWHSSIYKSISIGDGISNTEIPEEKYSDILEAWKREVLGELLDTAVDAALLRAKESGEFDGEDGEDGQSAYQLAVELGFEGTEEEWIESLHAKNHPYISLERIGSYLYKVSFDELPEMQDDYVPVGACSSYVKDGKLYRNLDWDYDETLSFHVCCNGFEGMSFVRGLTNVNLDDELISKLPYRITDGQNDYGIMVSTHVLFNDWDWIGSGNTSLTNVPFLILSNLKSMENIETDLASMLSDLYAPQSLIEMGYLLQFLVTDGATTYVITPPIEANGAYSLVDATENPKLSNFRWVPDAIVVRSELQNRPTGVERWNMMPCPLEDLRFTKAYEEPTRLSEFIGLRDTTKDSTDEELESIYEAAKQLYDTRTRNGVTWQTMHSVVYSEKGIEMLCVQENWNRNYFGAVSESSGESITDDDVLEAAASLDFITPASVDGSILFAIDEKIVLL